jgi:hypothetical protein
VYQLCESYRIDGYVWHRNIAGSGQLKELNPADETKLFSDQVFYRNILTVTIALKSNCFYKNTTRALSCKQ